MPLTAGRRLGAYEILRPLGEGGMGEVYRARDTRLGRDVALKVLPTDVTNEPGRLERFDREARAIASLNHPHIVTIYSTEEADGIKFLTMELVDGCTLSDLVMPNGIALATFIDLAIPLADALAAAHQKQITHRDLKPGNVMVSNDGRVKVLDFGLARVGGSQAGEHSMVETVAPITSPGMIVGTMPYMSPEQVEGAAIDARSDLFSMGVIFYELLSGSRPFRGGSSPALMSAILRDTPESLAGRRDDLPESLIRLVERLLEKRAEDRVQTARDVFNELKHIRRQVESAAASTPSAHRRGSRPNATRDAGLSVAVLPFTVRTADADTDAMASALTDDITTSLAKFSGLTVLAAQTTRAFKDSPLDVRQIADRLHARYIITGSLRRSGTTLRTNAQLIDARGGEQLWTENYDRQLGDAFAVQDDLTDHIVATIADKHGVLARSMVEAAAQAGPIEGATAANLLLHCWGFEHRPLLRAHAALRAEVEARVATDAGHPHLWAELANLYLAEHTLWLNPQRDPLGRALGAARRAIEIDRFHQAGWLSLAMTQFHLRDRVAFEEARDRAIKINPRNANALAWMGNLTTHSGEYERGCALTERSMAINPAHPGWLHFAVFTREMAAGRFEEALHAAKRVNMREFFWMYFAMAAACGHLGRSSEGKAAADEMVRLAPFLDDDTSLREFVARWYWPEEMIDAIVTGVFAARSGMPSQVRSERRSRPPSSASGTSTAPSGSVTAAPSIAVLPFVDLSEKKDQDWFCDGIAEEILNALAPLPGLRVAPRASAFSFRGGIADLKAIGDKLNVRTVLEGSVRRAGDRVRITTQLSDVEHGQVIWSHRFDREMQDIFDVQDEIARAIVERLRVTLATGTNRLVETRSTSLEAYELLLKGRTFVTRRGRAILEAIPLFERAITLDPNLSEAHALLGDAHRLLGLYGIVRASDAMPKARAAIDRALAIEPNQAEALASLAIIATVYEWDVDAMLSRSNRTLQIDPDHVRANTERALSVAFLGRPENWQSDAETHIQKARTVDPLNAWVMAADAAVHILSGRIEEGTNLAKAAIDLDANNFTAHWYYGWGLAELGRFNEVIDASVPALAMSGRHPQLLSTLAAVHAQLGQSEAIDAIRAELLRRSSTTFIGNAARATVAASAGRMEEARELLAIAIDEHDPYIAFFRMYGWRPLWKDERCSEMLKETTLFASTQK